MTERTTSLMVGIIIAREETGHVWQEHRWRPIQILIGQSELVPGQVISETSTQTQFFAGTFAIELHRSETPAYVVNLENDPPVAYIVLREKPDHCSTSALPIFVESVTMSPFEAQDFLDSGDDIVEPLPMSAPLIAWLDGFVARHHEEETFIKRKRDKLDIHSEKFGQEPIELVRPRQRRH